MKKFFKNLTSNKLGYFTLTVSLSYMFLGPPSQIWKIQTTQSAGDISMPMFALLTVQSLCWVAYGIKIKDYPMIIANAFGSLFAAIIVVQCFVFSAVF